MVREFDVELEDAVRALDGPEERLRVDLERGDDGREVVDAPWYGDNKRTLRPGVELSEWVAIAQWLELPAQGRLESLSYEDSQEDGVAREMRARQLL